MKDFLTSKGKKEKGGNFLYHFKKGPDKDGTASTSTEIFTKTVNQLYRFYLKVKISVELPAFLDFSMKLPSKAVWKSHSVSELGENDLATHPTCPTGTASTWRLIHESPPNTSVANFAFDFNLRLAKANLEIRNVKHCSLFTFPK